MEFTFQAKTKDGIIKTGKITAQDEAAAVSDLQKQSLFVISIKSASPIKFKFSFKKKVKLRDKIMFTRQLAIMIKGGLPLVEAIKALEEQTENEVFIEAIKQIRMDVSGGMALSNALSKHKNIYPNFYIAVVASGEKSGKLDKVLISLADQLQKDYDLISKVKAAISYPVVIVFALVGIMILMLIFVIPTLKTIFSEMGVPLPIFTRILLGTSSLLIDFWYIVIIAIVGLYFAVKFWSKTRKGGFIIDSIKIKIPIFGALLKKIYLARFARTTATLIESGLPMLEVLTTDKEVVGNLFFDPIFDAIGKDVESGVALSIALKKHKVFPIMIGQMVSVGERSGKIDGVLFQLADFYDKEVEATTASLASLIEPILILLIGGGIGVAIASVIMPIYSLVNVI